MSRATCALCALLLSLFALTACPSQDAVAQKGTAPIEIGMPQTFFHDIPPVVIGWASQSFSAVMRDTTGLNGKLVPGGDPSTVANNLVQNKVQLGVFHGFEFAWVQKKYPELAPLMLAVNTQAKVTAHVFVRKGNGIDKFADLKGKELVVPSKTKEHCHLYLERHCQGDASCGAKQFFGTVVASKNVETALDDLCHGKVDAVVIDAIGLEFYKDLKPGCFAKLKEVARSEAFMPPVIAYNPASLDAATLAKLREGLLRAHKTPMGDELMKMWKITSFEPVPANFQQAMDRSYKAYPPPEGK